MEQKIKASEKLTLKDKNQQAGQQKMIICTKLLSLIYILMSVNKEI